METISEALKPAPLKRPMDPSNMGQDVAALRGLTAMLNNPAVTGAEVPPGESTEIPVVRAPIQSPPAEPSVALPSPTIDGSKIFYTGRLKAGKDYVAALTGAKNFGFSEPLYFLLNYFFGVKDKDKHGARAFLQYAGQVGRGVIDEQYPLTPSRAVFEQFVRSSSKAKDFQEKSNGLSVVWADYGRDNNIWLDAVNRRIDEYLAANAHARVSNTNVRFEHEFSRLREQGFRHYHVMCSRQTWEARLKKDGIATNSPVLNDISERLAIALDADVTKKVSKQRVGKKLNVIWNDDAPAPSPRFYTVKEFLSTIGSPVVAEGPSQPEVNTAGMIIE